MPSSNSTSDSNVDHCRIAPADRSSNHRCDFRPSSWNYDVMYPREERADFGGLADIERREAGIIVHLRRSKTDQVAAGQAVAVPLGRKLRPTSTYKKPK